MEIVAERIFDLVKKRGLEQKEFAHLIGTTDKTVSAWKTSRTRSYTKFLPQISEVLGTSVEYLVTGNKKSPPPTDGNGLSPAKRALLDAVDGLSDEQCEKLLGIIEEAKKLF